MSCALCYKDLGNFKFSKTEGNKEVHACSRCRHFYLCIDQEKPVIECICDDGIIEDCCLRCKFERSANFGMDNLQTDPGKGCMYNLEWALF